MITTRNNQYWLPEVFNDFFNNDFVSKKMPHPRLSMWWKKKMSTMCNMLLRV